MRGRGERADDALRALRASMGRSRVEYHGVHYDFEDLLVEPHAVNEHVPFWVGGRSRRSLAAGRGAGRRLGAVRPQARRLRRLARRGGAPARVRGGRAAGRASSIPAPTPSGSTSSSRSGRAPAPPSWTCTWSTTRSSTTSSSSTPSRRDAASEVGFFSLTSGRGERRRCRVPALAPARPPARAVLDPRHPARHAWRADDACVALRAAVAADLAPVRHAVCYLMTDPVEETLTAFARLGRQPRRGGPLPGAGHAPPPRRVRAARRGTPHRRRACRPRRSRSGPHRGVYLMVEQPTRRTRLDRWWQLARRRSTSPPSSPPKGRRRRTRFRSHAPGSGTAPTKARGSAPRAVGPRREPRHGRLPRRRRRRRPRAASTRSCGSAGRTACVTPRLAGPFRSPVAYEAWPAGPVGSTGARRPRLPLLADHPRRRAGSGAGPGPLPAPPRATRCGCSGPATARRPTPASPPSAAACPPPPTAPSPRSPPTPPPSCAPSGRCATRTSTCCTSTSRWRPGRASPRC